MPNVPVLRLQISKYHLAPLRATPCKNVVFNTLRNYAAGTMPHYKSNTQYSEARPHPTKHDSVLQIIARTKQNQAVTRRATKDYKVVVHTTFHFLKPQGIQNPTPSKKMSQKVFQSTTCFLSMSSGRFISIQNKHKALSQFFDRWRRCGTFRNHENKIMEHAACLHPFPSWSNKCFVK